MPSLLDMFQARSLADNSPISFGDALQQRSNSLVGLGMGMLQPRSLAQGAPVSSPWTDALGGYQQGAQIDARTAHAQAQVAHQKRQEDLQRQQLAQGMLTSDIKEFQYAKSGGYKGSFQEWQKQQQQLQEKYSMSPSYYYDSEGKLQMGQLGSRGGMRPTGVTPSETQMKIDTGTGTQLGGSRTGLPPVAAPVAPAAPGAAPDTSLTSPTPMSQTTQPGFFPKDLRTKAAETELGKKTGAVQFDLPRIENETNQTLQTIDQLRNHPGKNSAIGAVAGRLPALGGDQAAFINYLKQAEGKAFIQSYQMLKGGGAITEIEGEKATAALARLQRVTTLPEFDKALNDFEDAVKSGYQKVKQQAGKSGNDGGSKPRLKYNPATGDFE